MSPVVALGVFSLLCFGAALLVLALDSRMSRIMRRDHERRLVVLEGRAGAQREAQASADQYALATLHRAAQP